MQSGLVFNIQRYSVHDGPGIRTTVFLKGCPLRCAWCHNPEGISPRREIVVIESRCLRCGECRRVCALAPNLPGESPLPARVAQCELCGACCEACPVDARRIAGEVMTVDQVLQAVLRDRVFYDESGGGVTFSGGEPLHQPEFLQAVLTACRVQGLHTAVDTCGLASTRHLLAIAPVTSLFLYDLKLADEESHEKHTGASNRRILKNLRALAKVHSNIWIRVPLVQGINDHGAELEETARVAASLPSVRQVNVLPYHATGLKKSERLGQGSTVSHLRAPTSDCVATAVRIFEREGLRVRTGG